MFKLMFVATVMFIGANLCAARVSCDSCGNECAPACGTRRFRPCCFNYLRRKRDPDTVVLSSEDFDLKPKSKLPYHGFETIPKQIHSTLIPDDYYPYGFQNNLDHHLGEEYEN